MQSILITLIKSFQTTRERERDRERQRERASSDFSVVIF